MFKNKKFVVILIVLAVLFVGGLSIGVFTSKNNSKNVQVVSIENDKGYDKLITDVNYEIPKKEIAKSNDKIIAKFNILSKDITVDQAKNLAKKIYETTISKQKGLNIVEVAVFNNGGSEFISDFYSDGLSYKFIYDKDYNTATSYSYDKVSVKENLTKTEWTINDIYDADGGIVKIDIAVTDGASKEDVMAQSKGLIKQIQSMNSDKKIEVAQANISTGTNVGFVYNTKFVDVIATTEKSTIN